MFSAVFGSVEQGIIYAIMALGVYLTFRVLDFPDLTVDGSFVTGAAVAATMIVFDYHPLVATLTAILVGFFAGCITGLLHTKGKINPLLSGILMMIALYSINLRIMGLTTENSVGRPNIPLLNSETIFSKFQGFWSNLGIDEAINGFLSGLGLEHLPSTWGTVVLMILVVVIIKFIADWFLQTEVGLAIRATGDNKKMIRSFSANTDTLVILGLGISNALVAFSGSLIAQYGKFADNGMGIGMIIIGLASVIIGEAIFGTKTIFRTTLAVVIGAVIYRIVLGLSLKVKILDSGDMKLITAVIVIAALIIPQILEKRREKVRKAKRQSERMAIKSSKGGHSVVETGSSQ
ncbi:ABC transporter permease [Sporosarcina sp. P21c]|uniref:ABC transporter permease n=1 Tax=Sporosarcina TaxID=1569 RepID=UPI000A14AD8D|nr:MULTISPECIES: ABC transporter permease [Sporosarcina]ARJ40136.1 ABC transporter permease [Sporosarcina ureae]PIC68667.1 ABC transporter permease [Sporosarcina sp. P16a]PIC84562.1 ABC transporter permease [Sporosarcina sp. P1]PIC91148.1 ABC transporter permease [Sporosarcina sp. P21c]PIC93720.1 ABC transporter permease [Sporosarcina sp. P25]